MRIRTYTEPGFASVIPNAAEALSILRRANLPVTLCWATLEAANHWMVVTVPKGWREQIALSAEDFCRRIGDTPFAEHAGAGVVKVLVIEDDVDATDTLEVLWAFAYVADQHEFHAPCALQPAPSGRQDQSGREHAARRRRQRPKFGRFLGPSLLLSGATPFCAASGLAYLARRRGTDRFARGLA